MSSFLRRFQLFEKRKTWQILSFLILFFHCFYFRDNFLIHSSDSFWIMFIFWFWFSSTVLLLGRIWINFECTSNNFKWNSSACSTRHLVSNSWNDDTKFLSNCHIRHIKTSVITSHTYTHTHLRTHILIIYELNTRQRAKKVCLNQKCPHVK